MRVSALWFNYCRYELRVQHFRTLRAMITGAQTVRVIRFENFIATFEIHKLYNNCSRIWRYFLDYESIKIFDRIHEKVNQIQ